MVIVQLGPAAAALAGERSEYPAAARQRYERAQELQRQGRFLEAIQAYEEALGLGMQDFPRLFLDRAAAYASLREYAKAIAHYTDFIAKFDLERSCRL
jgi:tetratricopeptide (TPR) repeat protein